MDVVGLDHLNLTVRSFEESVAWYGRVFRFALVEEGIGEGIRWGILRSEGGRGFAMLCVYERPEYRPTDGEALRDLGLHGIRHFGLRVRDEREWRALLERERLEAEEIRYPRSTSWYIHDPTGYDIEVSCWDRGLLSFGPSAPERKETA